MTGLEAIQERVMNGYNGYGETAGAAQNFDDVEALLRVAVSAQALLDDKDRPITFEERMVRREGLWDALRTSLANLGTRGTG